MKAQMNLFIIVAILFIIILIGMTGFFLRTKEIWGKNQTWICQSSVEAASFPLALQSAEGFANSLKCPTQRITLKQKTEEELEKKVVGLFKNCWDMFGKGKQLWDARYPRIFCSPCYIVDFAKPGLILFEEGIYTYLGENKEPLTQKYYQNYFRGKFDSTVLNLYTGNTYAIIFAQALGEDKVKELANSIGRTLTQPEERISYLLLRKFDKERESIEELKRPNCEIWAAQK